MKGSQHSFCLENGLDAPFVDSPVPPPVGSFESTLLVLVYYSTGVDPQTPHPDRVLDFFDVPCEQIRPSTSTKDQFSKFASSNVQGSNLSNQALQQPDSILVGACKQIF